MNKNTTNRTPKIMAGALVAGAALAISGAGFAASVPAWMGRIQANSCVETYGWTLSFNKCTAGQYNYGNVPLTVNNDSGDVSVSASFTATNQGSESGCYDDDSCGRTWALNSNASFVGVTPWACVETRNGITERGSMDPIVVPKLGYASVELRGIHSSSCANQFRTVKY